MEQIVIVPGNPDAVFTCITSDTRPHPSHCWSRAASHILRDTHFHFFERLEAEAACWQMVQALSKKPFPPQRAPVKWGFGKGWPGQR